jgi:hypothetical protein
MSLTGASDRSESWEIADLLWYVEHCFVGETPDFVGPPMSTSGGDDQWGSLSTEGETF